MSGNLSQRNKSLCSHKNLYTDVHGWNQPDVLQVSCGQTAVVWPVWNMPQVKHTGTWMDPTGAKGYIHI